MHGMSPISLSKIKQTESSPSATPKLNLSQGIESCPFCFLELDSKFEMRRKSGIIKTPKNNSKKKFKKISKFFLKNFKKYNYKTFLGYEYYNTFKTFGPSSFNECNGCMFRCRKRTSTFVVFANTRTAERNGANDF